MTNLKSDDNYWRYGFFRKTCLKSAFLAIRCQLHLRQASDPKKLADKLSQILFAAMGMPAASGSGACGLSNACSGRAGLADFFL